MTLYAFRPRLPLQKSFCKEAERFIYADCRASAIADFCRKYSPNIWLEKENARYAWLARRIWNKTLGKWCSAPMFYLVEEWDKPLTAEQKERLF